MKADKIILISQHITPVPQVEIDQLEEKFNTILPDDYKMLMTNFGDGELAGEIHFRTPQAILEEYEEHQAMWHSFYRPDGEAQPWFDDEQDVMTYDQLMQSMLLGSTFNSDELIHCPDTPDLIYINSIRPANLVAVNADIQSICREIFEFDFYYTFLPYHDKRYVYHRTAKDFSINRLKCLDFCNQYWGYDGIVSRKQYEREGHWWLSFFVPEIAGEVNFDADDGETHIEHEPNGGVVIYQGDNSGGRFNVSVRVDEEFKPQALEFLRVLEASKLVKWTVST